MDSTKNNTTMEAQDYDRMKELKEFDDSKMGVKGLSDSGITSIPRIFVHPPEILSDLIKSPDSDGISIPVIDLSGMNSPSERAKIVDLVKDAARSWGFFQVVNHGIPVTAMDDTISSLKAFYDTPYEARSKYYKRTLEPRGVKYMSNNDLFHTPAAGWRDTIQVWSPEPAEEIPEACREAVVAWFSRSTEAAEVEMELLAEGLGLERSKFKEMSCLDAKLFVGNYYPYCPQPDRTVGLASHTDPGFLTVVMQNHLPGMQVKHGEHGWVDVKPLRGSLIINVGDFLQIVSNGEYKSVQHRVVANASKETRISVLMFFLPKIWKDDGYGPLPELLSPQKPAIYRNFSQLEFIANYFNRALSDKSLIDTVTI